MKGIDYNVYEETMEMNKNIRERDLILKGYFSDKEYMGGVRHFKTLPLTLLKLLISEGFVDTTDKQNNAPTIGDIVTLAEQMEQKGYYFFFGGYAVSLDRDDYRVSIDTVKVTFYFDESNHLNNKIIERFFKDADEKDVDERSMRFWYD